MADNKINPELLKLLMQMQATQQKQQQKPMTRRQVIFSTIMQKVLKILNWCMTYIDRFIYTITKVTDTHDNDVAKLAKAPIIFGILVIIFFFGFGGLWSCLAPLDSAAVAPGVVVSSSNRRIVNHQIGGVIKRIYVNQGDSVKAGDPIVALDDVNIKAENDIVFNNYLSMVATEDRLRSESNGSENIQFSEILLKDATKPEVQKILQNQRSMFESKREGYNNTISARERKIEQTMHQIAGLKARKDSLMTNHKIISERVKALSDLSSKGYVSRAHLLELQGKEASVHADQLAVDSEIQKSEQEILQVNVEIAAFKNHYMENIHKELKEAHIYLSQFREKYMITKDALEKSIITSPVDGTITVMRYHTVGSVVHPGYTVAEISPDNDNLVIEARISPRNIDAVKVGLKTKIRFSAFKSRTTPSFTGTVVALSSDVVSNDSTAIQQGREFSYAQEPFTYLARIEIDMNDFNKAAKESNIKLHPGMQAEVYIITGERTLLKYLLDPVTETVFRSFNER